MYTDTHTNTDTQNKHTHWNKKHNTNKTNHKLSLIHKKQTYVNTDTHTQPSRIINNTPNHLHPTATLVSEWQVDSQTSLSRHQHQCTPSCLTTKNNNQFTQHSCTKNHMFHFTHSYISRYTLQYTDLHEGFPTLPASLWNEVNYRYTLTIIQVLVYPYPR